MFNIAHSFQNDAVGNAILYLLGNGFRIYIIFRFISAAAITSQPKRKFLPIAYGGFFVLNSFIELFFHLPYLNLLINILCLLLLVWLQTKGWSTGVLLVVEICGINIVCEWLMTSIFNVMGIMNHQDTKVEFFSDFLMFLVFLLLEKRGKLKNGGKVPVSSWLVIFFIPMFSIFLSCGIRLSDFSQTFSLISLIGLVLLNVLVFGLYDQLSASYAREKNEQLQKQQQRIYVHQIESQKEMSDRVMQLKHDLKNHFLCLLNFANQNDVGKIIYYLENLLNKMQMYSQYVHTGNDVVDGILNFKIGEAKRWGVCCETRLQIPNQLKFSLTDLASILGNLMDNALLAAKNSAEKKLEICMNYEGETLFLTIINSYPTDSLKVNKQNGTFFTTKKDASQHGIGLKSVRQLVSQYDGILSLSHTDTTFTACVLMHEPMEKEMV